MGSLLGSIVGEGKPQKVDWKQLERMMALDARMNRFNDQGIFGGTEWTENPDGTWERRHVVNEALQPGIEAIMGRAVSPVQRSSFGMPSQFGSLMDAKMANQMGRHGLFNEGGMPNLRQDNYGTRFGNQFPQQFNEVQGPQQGAPSQMPAQPSSGMGEPPPPAAAPPSAGPPTGGGGNPNWDAIAQLMQRR
jgi:hypothetical protein